MMQFLFIFVKKPKNALCIEVKNKRRIELCFMKNKDKAHFHFKFSSASSKNAIFTKVPVNYMEIIEKKTKEKRKEYCR